MRWPPKGRRVAIARYLMDMSGRRLRMFLRRPVKAAKKAQSVGLRRAFETCTRKVPQVTGNRVDGETTAMRKISSGE